MTTPVLRFACTPYANQLALSYFIPEVAANAKLLAADGPLGGPRRLARARRRGDDRGPGPVRTPGTPPGISTWPQPDTT